MEFEFVLGVLKMHRLRQVVSSFQRLSLQDGSLHEFQTLVALFATFLAANKHGREPMCLFDEPGSPKI